MDPKTYSACFAVRELSRFTKLEAGGVFPSQPPPGLPSGRAPIVPPRGRAADYPSANARRGVPRPSNRQTVVALAELGIRYRYLYRFGGALEVQVDPVPDREACNLHGAGKVFETRWLTAHINLAAWPDSPIFALRTFAESSPIQWSTFRERRMRTIFWDFLGGSPPIGSPTAPLRTG